MRSVWWIRQTGEPVNVHPHGEVLALNVAGADVLGIGVAGYGRLLASRTFCRAIALLCPFLRLTVQLDQHRVVDLAAKIVFTTLR
jgi:hypothetical protein